MARLRELIPQWARLALHQLRAWVLSLNLPSRGRFLLNDKERQASSNIAIIVAVHNAPEVTRRCLRSLETFGGDAEIIIVDDGSTLNASRDMLDESCSRNGWILIRHEKAVGHSRASEAGIAFATRPYLCLLNSDAIVTGRSWLGIVRAFETAKNIGVVGPSTSHTVGPQVVRRALHCRHYWSDEQVSCFAEEYVVRHQADPIVDVSGGVGGFAFFVRRDLWNQLAGFDKGLPDYGNESEFCRRAKIAGFRIVWTKGSYVHHLGSSSYSGTLGSGGIREKRLAATAYIRGKYGL